SHGGVGRTDGDRAPRQFQCPLHPVNILLVWVHLRAPPASRYDSRPDLRTKQCTGSGRSGHLQAAENSALKGAWALPQSPEAIDASAGRLLLERLGLERNVLFAGGFL